MKRRALLGMPVLLGACSVLPQRPYQETRVWPLVVHPPEARRAPARAPVLLVRPLRAAAGLEARGLQTVVSDGSLRTDPYEEWAAPPADAVTDQLRRWITAAGLFSAVIGPGSRLTASYVLEGELTALWAVPAAARARASIGYVVVDQRGGSSSLLLQDAADGVAPLSGEAAAARAMAEIAALSDAFARITARLATLPSKA